MAAAAQGSPGGHGEPGSGPTSGTGEQHPTSGSALSSSRPELIVGAAFVGGLVAAKILKLVRR